VNIITQRYNEKDKQRRMSHLKSTVKSILLGGTAAGLISLVPIVNLLNLLLMMWMGFGGALCFYTLSHENPQTPIPPKQALLFGGTAGALGSLIFSLASYLFLSFVSLKNIEKVITLFDKFWPGTEEEFLYLMEGNNLINTFLLVMVILLIISVLSGALGAIVTRTLMKEKNKNRPISDMNKEKPHE